jgi:hypothetical protein
MTGQRRLRFPNQTAFQSRNLGPGNAQRLDRSAPLVMPACRAFLSRLAWLAALAGLSGGAMAGQVALAWDSVSGAAGYRLYYGTTSKSYALNVDAKSATNYTVTGLTDGTRYYFAVRAYNATTTSGYSGEVNTVVPTAAPPSGGSSGGSPSGGSTTSGGSNTSGGNTGGSATPVKQGLVAAYGFEESGGSQVVDASGYGNNGTISGATRATTTQFGRALKFNGTNNWITVNDSSSLDLTTKMTLEAWIYPTTSLSGWRTIIMKERTGGLAFTLNANSSANRPNSTVNVGGSDRQLTAGWRLPANAWTHLAATYDGSRQKLYVNGALVGSRSQTGAITLSSGALRIGGNSVWPQYFNGYIDEVRVYNRALSPTEIASDSKMAVVGLVMSKLSNRSNPVPLNGLAVSGNIYVSYVLISPTAASKPAKQVKFWLDDANPESPTGSPRRTDYRSPFDFAGTRRDGTATAFSTSGLTKGVHTITAQVTLSDGTVLPYITGKFTIN